MNISIIDAIPAHAYALAPRLRDTDLRELEATSGRDPRTILLDAIGISTHCWAAVRDGDVDVLFGAAPLVDGLGSAWLLASPDIYRYPKQFLKYSREYVAKMHEDYPVLTNFVDDRNTPSHGWLKKLGFFTGIHVPEYGIGKLPFTQYTSMGA